MRSEPKLSISGEKATPGGSERAGKERHLVAHSPVCTIHFRLGPNRRSSDLRDYPSKSLA